MQTINRCIRCRRYQNEAAGPGCGNPTWHDGDAGDQAHFYRTCDSTGHCPCYEGEGARCCTCRDRKL